MKNRAAILSLGVVITCVVSGQAQDQPLFAQRQIRIPPAKRIIDELRPEDRVVNVIDSNPPPSVMRLSPEIPALPWVVRAADAVVLVEVAFKQAELNEQANWIRSRVTAVAIDVLKAPAAQGLALGDSFSFEEEGGRISLGDVEVNGVVPGVRTIEVGKRYLMFLTVDKDVVAAGPHLTYELLDGRFKSLGSPVRTPLRVPEIEGHPESVALARVREAISNSR